MDPELLVVPPASTTDVATQQIPASQRLRPRTCLFTMSDFDYTEDVPRLAFWDVRSADQVEELGNREGPVQVRRPRSDRKRPGGDLGGSFSILFSIRLAPVARPGSPCVLQPLSLDNAVEGLHVQLVPKLKVFGHSQPTVLQE